jgi:hypothetical protein
MNTDTYPKIAFPAQVRCSLFGLSETGFQVKPFGNVPVHVVGVRVGFNFGGGQKVVNVHEHLFGRQYAAVLNGSQPDIGVVRT